VKFLLVIAVIAVVIWFLRSGRAAPAAPPGRSRAPGLPQPMVECAACGVHLPRVDALPAPDGRLYCCAEHRASGGR
jgi:uncharacterized protein